MRITDEMQILENLMKFDEDMLIFRIGEAWEAFSKAENVTKISKEDRFVLGLRYSEFFADQSLCGEDYDRSLVLAENKARIYREKLGITMTWLMDRCSKLLFLN